MTSPPSPFRPAVVLSCAGAPDGDLNIVRALGRRGIPVYVASEYEGSPAASSRYCRESLLIPGFTREPEASVSALIDLARRLGQKPVLFPTADPDLKMVSDWRTHLDPYFEIPIARTELVRALFDKRQFAEMAARHGFPVPATYSLDGVDDLDDFASLMTFPVIVKPANTLIWARPDVERIVGSRKAVIALTRQQFLDVCKPLMPYAKDLIVQRYIPGNDEQYYDMQAYFDRQGKVLAWFTARKIRTSPPAVGAGCYVESVRVEQLAEIGVQSLQAVGYTGLVDLDFKVDCDDQTYVLIEVNPRAAAWNILPTACGINLPYIAYADLTGSALEPIEKQQESRRYLHFANDLRAFLQYHRLGQWTVTGYVGSLLGKRLVFQRLALDDLQPLLRSAYRSLLLKARRLPSSMRNVARGLKTGSKAR